MAYKFSTIKELPAKFEKDSPVETDIDQEGEEAYQKIRANSDDFILARKLLDQMKYTFDMYERQS